MTTKALRTAQIAEAKADVAAYLVMAMLSALIGRGVLKREDAAFALDSLRGALPPGDAEHGAELEKIAGRIGQMFDSAEELRRQRIESAVGR